MKYLSRNLSLTIFLAMSGGAFVSLASAHDLVFTAGPTRSIIGDIDLRNHDADSYYAVRWRRDEGDWWMSGESNRAFLVADGDAAPTLGGFRSPTAANDSGSFIELEPGWKAPARQLFKVLGGDPYPEVSQPISGWYAQTLEPGWEWVLPAPEETNPSLVTVDGQDWEWQFDDSYDPLDPTIFSITFAPVKPGAQLGFHTELLWTGTPENTIWGDKMNDDGTRHYESDIITFNYPTVVIPEPTTIFLALTGLLFTVCRHRTGATVWLASSANHQQDLLPDSTPPVTIR